MNRKQIISSSMELIDVVGTRVVVLDKGKTLVKEVEDLGTLCALKEAVLIRDLNRKLDSSIRKCFPSMF